MNEWMSEWQHGRAPACLSHETCPLQSQDMDKMGVAPQTIWVSSAFWFLGDPPPVPPLLTTFLHESSAHPNCSAHCPWNITSRDAGASILVLPFSGVLSFCFSDLSHKFLWPRLSSRFLPLCLNPQWWAFPWEFLNAFVCLIHLWCNVYYLVHIFHWFLRTDSYAPHFNIFWVGMHIQLMMMV